MKACDICGFVIFDDKWCENCEEYVEGQEIINNYKEVREK